MLISSVAPASASSLAGGPGSQMSSHTLIPDAPAGDVDHGADGARLEVALLVEHAVVGQVHLAVDRVHLARREHRGGVEDVLGALGEADDRDDPVGVRLRARAARCCASARKCSFSSRSSGG